MAAPPARKKEKVQTKYQVAARLGGRRSIYYFTIPRAKLRNSSAATAYTSPIARNETIEAETTKPNLEGLFSRIPG